MVIIGSRRFPVVVVIISSQQFSMVPSGYHRLPVVLIGSSDSRLDLVISPAEPHVGICLLHRVGSQWVPDNGILEA